MAEQRPDRQGGGRKNSSNGGGRPGLPNPGMRFGRGLFGWVLFICLGGALMFAVCLFADRQ